MSVILSLAQLMGKWPGQLIGGWQLTFAGGTMSINLPKFLQAFNYLSPAKYSIASLAVYTFRDIQFSCTKEQQLPDGNCPQSDGIEVLKLYKLNTNPKLNLMALGITAIAYRMVAYFILKVKRERWLSRLWRRGR
jgi:hypothetical protein